MSPDRVVYVSCDSGTLGRDVKRFAEAGYDLRKATAVDMFPRTSHVETVALFQQLSLPIGIVLPINLCETNHICNDYSSFSD